MARTIQVTPELLESAATRINGLAIEYKDQYDTLYRTNDDMKAAWQGKDNQAYIQQIAGFKDDFEKMYELMLAYEDFLRKSAKAYRETQDTITGEARKLVN